LVGKDRATARAKVRQLSCPGERRDGYGIEQGAGPFLRSQSEMSLAP
jgi:hypothetical protein